MNVSSVIGATGSKAGGRGDGAIWGDGSCSNGIGVEKVMVSSPCRTARTVLAFGFGSETEDSEMKISCVRACVYVDARAE